MCVCVCAFVHVVHVCIHNVFEDGKEKPSTYLAQYINYDIVLFRMYVCVYAEHVYCTIKNVLLPSAIHTRTHTHTHTYTHTLHNYNIFLFYNSMTFDFAFQMYVHVA